MWATSCKKGQNSIFYQRFYFPIFWKDIMLRLIPENMSTLPVQLSFLWGWKHNAYATVAYAKKCDVLICT